MERNKMRENFFILFMSIIMSYGKELYNLSLLNKGLKPNLFVHVFNEVWYVTVIVFIISKFFGLPLAGKLFSTLFNPKGMKVNKIIILRTFSTVCVMSPTMSLVAAFLFKGATLSNFLNIWLITTLFNFPMALLYQIFFAGPVVRYVTNKIFQNKGV